MIGRSQAQNQQPYYQQPATQYQTPAQGNTQDATIAQLQLLGQLRESGVLSEEEFQAQKQRILQGL
jgi:hypothetical protein